MAQRARRAASGLIALRAALYACPAANCFRRSAQLKRYATVDEALTAFSQVAPRQAKVVELRYFGGLTEEEIVAALKISPRTVRRDWDLAKAWLLRELSHTMGEQSRL